MKMQASAVESREGSLHKSSPFFIESSGAHSSGEHFVWMWNKHAACFEMSLLMIIPAEGFSYARLMEKAAEPIGPWQDKYGLTDGKKRYCTTTALRADPPLVFSETLHWLAHSGVVY